ncbi:hypothetical protein GGS20DRAFT_508771 [Poronia punctata]|nr:hypothetical protein GGS20DRAFT_508771 [Poronia punctata]
MTSTHHLESVSSGCGDRVTLSIRWNKARIVVDLDPSPKGGTMEDSFIEKYNAAVEDGDEEQEEMITDQILDAIVHVGRSLFDRLAPPDNNNNNTVDLHSLLFPKEYLFYFCTDLESNTPELTPKSNNNEDDKTTTTTTTTTTYEKFDLKHQLPEEEEEEDLSVSLPKFSTRDIHVLQKLLGDGYIAHVSAGGQEMCCKVVDDEIRIEALQREVSCLLTITTYHLNTQTQTKTTPDIRIIRVPKLLGLVIVKDEEGNENENGRVIGFLQEYVPCSDTWELSTLRNVESISSISKSRREKWARQIRETVRVLHDEIGITWGDGKAGNVLIHRDTDDAWIVDFGGGWTDGWVSRELSGTVEGDLVAVEKICEFLEV